MCNSHLVAWCGVGVLIVAMVVLAISEPAIARMMPTPGPGETLVWSSGEWRETSDADAVAFSGPRVIGTRRLSKDELVGLCYDGEANEDQIADCLATFEPVKPGPWVDPKIAEEDYALLDGMAGEATDVYLELTPLPGLNPVDQFLETLYTQQELFDSGVLRKEEVFSAITEDYFAARRSRFDEIAPDLFDVPGVAPVANLQGLDFVHIKMSIDALAEIEEFP